jgi:hypothetical protein
MEMTGELKLSPSLIFLTCGLFSENFFRRFSRKGLIAFSPNPALLQVRNTIPVHRQATRAP